MAAAVTHAAVRKTFVAGTFYPAAAEALRAAVAGYVAGAGPASAPVPKAIIAPHAGYVYSGPVAGSAYARIAPARGRITRVVLAGPSHRVPFRGIAVPSVGFYASPLGDVPLDRESIARVLSHPFVHELDEAHAAEHSLEVQVPFLQEVLGTFILVPLVVGDASPAEVAAVLDVLWGGPETLVVVSSDLSHYENYDTARRMDADTARAITALAVDGVAERGACGRRPIRGLLELARRRGLRASAIDLRSSGDTAGGRDRVVGYGSFVFEEDARLSDGDRATLLGVAGEVIARGAAGGTTSGEPAAELDTYPGTLTALRASFVTLKREGRLRGCIGSLEPRAPLVLDVARNAFRCAFQDPRFPPVSADEVPALETSISVLSAPAELRFDSELGLAAALRPGIDGVILAEGKRRGTFLPQVWSSVPEPAAFLQRLKAKAGMAEGHWSPDVRAWRYTTETFGAAARGTVH